MYLEALNSSLIVDVGFLSVDNLPKAVGASCSKSMFSYEILDYTEHSVSVASHTLSAKTTADTSELPEVTELPEVHVLPSETQNNNTLPIKAQNNKIMPIEAQNKNTMPIY